jgi:hypothetical protein
MRPRDRILANLEAVYRENYDRAKAESLPRRMEELDAAYMRDQLMMEVLLDIRDLLGQPKGGSTGGTIEQLHHLSKIVRKP